MSATAHHIEKPTPETVFGFWVYIMTDCMIFASLFAVFAVQRTQYAGGPTGRDLFDLKSTLEETVLLLLSSTTCGYAIVGLHRRNMRVVLAFLAATFLLGAGFVTLEVSEFLKLVSENAGPDRSAFLSSFFILVGTHGLHVTCGLIWMLVLVFDMTAMRKGLSPKLINRLIAFSLFWHFLDIIWICLFTFVYLDGFLS
jgi:cytochrome o ubiquinol oxidase subunit III